MFYHCEICFETSTYVVVKNTIFHENYVGKSQPTHLNYIRFDDLLSLSSKNFFQLKIN